MIENFIWNIAIFLILRKKWENKEISPKEALEEMRNTIYGMDCDEAVQMFLDAGWNKVEVIYADSEYYDEGPYVADRMKIWINGNDKVVRAVAG